MNREIKFRIRLEAKDNSQIITIFAPLFGDINSLMDNPVDMNEWTIISCDEFTGLHDKNGKEIYEGDIMCWEKYQNTKHHGAWVVEIKPLKATKSWSSTGEEDAVIIGNIYENKDLI